MLSRAEAACYVVRLARSVTFSAGEFTFVAALSLAEREGHVPSIDLTPSILPRYRPNSLAKLFATTRGGRRP